MTVCAVPVCDRPAQARHLCSAHYLRWWRSGQSTDVAIQNTGLAIRAVEAHVANPWAGQRPCPQCGSDEWTMPFSPGEPIWRCVKGCHGGCGITFRVAS